MNNREKREQSTPAPPPPPAGAERMAAAPYHSIGFFSAVWSRFRAAWRHERGSDAALESEAAIRSRLARRAGSARRLGRGLAFVSVNLEVLLFVCAFWRARRRNLSWRRQPLQALPMLVIPALAALIYAAFVRFTRTLDLKDKKTLQQQHESDDQKDQNSAQKCGPVDDATNVSSQSDLAEASKLDKHHQPSRDDGGGDLSWGCTKDFQPLHSDGLRERTLSIEKTHKTSSSTFRQPITWSSEHLPDEQEDPNYAHSSTQNHSNSGADDAENAMACSAVETGSSVPACMISTAMDHDDFSLRISCPKSNGCLAEEDAVQIALIGPKSDLPAVAEMHYVGIENRSSKVHVSEDNMTPFISEELSLNLYTVQNTECNVKTSAYTLCSQQTEKEDVSGGVCLVKVSTELSVLSSPELVVEGGKGESRKESCELTREEENDLVINSEEEALLGMPAINTAEHCSGSSGFSLLAQDSDMMEVPAVIPASNYTASMKLSAEHDGCKDDETSNVHFLEQKGQEAFMDPPVVDSFEDSLAMSEFLAHSAVTNITEVMGVVEEGLSEESSNHQNDVATSSDDGGNTENVMNDPGPIQLIPEDNITDSLQDGQETLSGPLYHSSSRSAGVFLSSSDISNDEDYSRNPNSYSLYANSVENKEPLVSQGGGSESKDETDFAFLDTPILLNEVASVESWTDTAVFSRCIPESNRAQSVCGGKRALPETSESANFGLEESLISPDQEINLEIFSLYSRSSSCVSEVNVVETLRVGTFPALENDDDFSFDEKASMMVPNLKHAVQYGADLQSTVGSHFFSQNTSPKAQSQDPLLFNETSFYPDNASVSENNSDDAKLLLCSGEVNLIESLDGDQIGNDQQQDEVDLFFEDICMAHQGATSENRLNSLGYHHISDANMIETLQGAERLSSEIFHDDILCKEKTSVSLDGGNNIDNSSSAPGSVMHTAQNNAVVLLSLQGPEKVMVSISQYEVDIAEKNGSNCIYAEAAMTGAIQGVNKSLAQSHYEHPGTYFSTDKENHPEYLRPSSSMADDNLIELLAAGQERSFDCKDENPSSFEETSPSENPSNNEMSASHTSNDESVTSSGKGLTDPKLKVVDSFDKIPGDEQANRSLKENALSCEQIARTRVEVNCCESQDFTEASNLNCTEASESVNEGFFEPEHQEGLELVLSQVGMPFLIDEGEETEKDHGSSSIACASSHHDISILETLQVLPVSAASEKGFLEESKVCEWRCTYKEPKDPKVKDMKENVEDLDEDHENNPIGLLGSS